jgi:Glycosyltransferases, probably involved in cell wall biogenesis
MSTYLIILWAFCLGALIYVYAGFLVLLGLASVFLKKRHRIDEQYEPTVTLIISAYNEEAVIRDKIENSKALAYPTDKLNILVVSDCSSDRTDAIVRTYDDLRIRLLRMEERKGKTCGLNVALEQVRTDLVLFSDANALYDAQAVRKMVRHFADSTIGYVVGHARYINDRASAAGTSESLYWNFATRIKKWESDVHSVVGGDGAMYMIRRTLYQPLAVTDINDFVNPLHIIAAGYRGIFDPESFYLEEPTADFGKEFGRKVCIVNRSFDAFLRVRQCINPLRFGSFSWLLFSRVLRWFSPFFLAAHFVLSLLLPLSGCQGGVGYCFLLAYLLLVAAAYIDLWSERRGVQLMTSIKFPYYFVLMNVASAMGVLSRLQGQRIVTWSTIRNNGTEQSMGATAVSIVLAGAGLLMALRLLAVTPVAMFVFEAAIFLLFFLQLYAIAGYPIVLRIIHASLLRPHQIDDRYEPSVTLLIAAYNEANVLEDKLANSLQLNYPRNKLRILVVSDGSTDATDMIAARFADQGVDLLSLSPNRGKITALNEGFKTIFSEIVVLSDANVLYDPAAIRKLARHFIDPSIGAVSGKVTLLNEHLSYAAAEAQYYGIEHSIQQLEGETGSLIGSDGAMYALRRELYRPLPADTILDDFVISMGVVSQGRRLIHEPEAVAYERNVEELGREFQRKARIIAGGVQALLRRQIFPPRDDLLTWFKLISHKVLRWIIGPMALLMTILAVFRLQMDSPPSYPMAVFVGLLAFFFLLGCALCFVPALRRTKLLVVPHYLLAMFGASLVGCWRGLLGSQSVTWKQTQE